MAIIRFAISGSKKYRIVGNVPAPCKQLHTAIIHFYCAVSQTVLTDAAAAAIVDDFIDFLLLLGVLHLRLPVQIMWKN